MRGVRQTGRAGARGRGLTGRFGFDRILIGLGNITIARDNGAGKDAFLSDLTNSQKTALDLPRQDPRLASRVGSCGRDCP